MSKVEWSDEQPPKWKSAPAETPESMPPQRLGLGALLSETWEQVVANFSFVAQQFAYAMAASLGLGAAVLALTYTFITPDAEFLNFVYSQSLTADQTEASATLIGSAGFVIALTLLTTIPQFWYTASTANRFLNSANDSAAGWGRLLWTNLLLAFWIFVALTPSLAILIYGLVTASVELTGFGGLLVLISIGLVVYFSLGFIPLTGVVLAEGLGGQAALTRSLALAKRSRFQMFLPLAIVTILVAIGTSAVSQFGLLITNVLFGLIGFVVTNAFTILLATLFSASISISIYRNQLRTK